MRRLRNTGAGLQDRIVLRGWILGNLPDCVVDDSEHRYVFLFQLVNSPFPFQHRFPQSHFAGLVLFRRHFDRMLFTKILAGFLRRLAPEVFNDPGTPLRQFDVHCRLSNDLVQAIQFCLGDVIAQRRAVFDGGSAEQSQRLRHTVMKLKLIAVVVAFLLKLFSPLLELFRLLLELLGLPLEIFRIRFRLQSLLFRSLQLGSQCGDDLLSSMHDEIKFLVSYLPVVSIP